MIVVVAVTLLSMMILLCLLTWGLIRIVSRDRGTLVIDLKAVATLFRCFFHVEYRPSGRPDLAPESVDRTGSVELPVNSLDDASVRGAELQNGGGIDDMT